MMQQSFGRQLVRLLISVTLVLLAGCATTDFSPVEDYRSNVRRAKIFLAAGDFRRAIEACQQEVTERPSADSYVYLTYVYQALDAYLDALARSYEVEEALVAFVVVIAQEQSLGAKLHQLRLVGPSRNVRALAALVVDRRDAAPFTLQQVDLGAEAERLRREPHRALVDRLWGPAAVVLPLTTLPRPVDVAMLVAPVHRVVAVGELPLDPLEVAEARAVRELVEHANREEGRHVLDRRHRR